MITFNHCAAIALFWFLVMFPIFCLTIWKEKMFIPGCIIFGVEGAALTVACVSTLVCKCYHRYVYLPGLEASPNSTNNQPEPQKQQYQAVSVQAPVSDSLSYRFPNF